MTTPKSWEHTKITAKTNSRGFNKLLLAQFRWVAVWVQSDSNERLFSILAGGRDRDSATGDILLYDCLLAPTDWGNTVTLTQITAIYTAVA